MKAIVCPQCGALIKRISVKDKFAFCDYCGAKSLLEDNKERIVEIPDKAEEKKLTPWEQHQENYRKVRERAARYNSLPDSEPAINYRPHIFALFLMVVGVGLFGVVLIFKYSSPPSKEVKNTNSLKLSSTPKIEYPSPTPLPPPPINYQVKVQWNGANDMEHFENPQIETSKLPTTDINELKKTVFKNRSVQVKITIDTTGEVISAEAVSGHPILKESATEAARKTLFNSRAKPANRILTYYFRLVEE